MKFKTVGEKGEPVTLREWEKKYVVQETIVRMAHEYLYLSFKLGDEAARALMQMAYQGR